MNRFTLALVLITALAPVAASADFGFTPMVFTSNPPTLDGTSAMSEWFSPTTEILTAGSDPAPVISSGSFAGMGDLTINVTALFSLDQIYLRILVEDDLDRAGDTLTLELGSSTFTFTDSTVIGPVGDWQVARNPANPWEIEIRVAGSLADAPSLPGAIVSFGVRYDDDDDGADGVMERTQAGGGALIAVNPRSDLLGVADLLDAMVPTFSEVGNLAKRAARLRKAADASRWTDDFTLASKSDAAKSLDRVRNVIKKLEKYRAKADASIAFHLDQPMETLLRAMRLAAARLQLLGLQTAGSDMASTMERMSRGETAAAEGDRVTAAKQYRKAAKKAASQVY